MPGDKPGRSRFKLIFVFCCILLLAGGALLVSLLRANQAPPPALVLPDGTKVSVIGAAFGTNNVMGSRFARLVAHAPGFAQELIGSLFSSSAVAVDTYYTATPSLVLWFAPNTAGPVAHPSEYNVAFTDATGFFPGDMEGLVRLNDGSVTPLVFTAFPRRERILTLHFYHFASKSGYKDCGALEIRNPVYRAYPQWQPETLPAARRVGDIEATLERVITGLNPREMKYSISPDGGLVVDYGTNRENGQDDTACQLHLHPLGDTNQAWQITKVVVSDATGNALTNSSLTLFPWPSGIFAFSPGLWSGEAAWKLGCEIKRTQGFSPGEIFTFANVPLPGELQTNQLGWSTNFKGVTVTLDNIVNHEPIKYNDGSWHKLTEAFVSMVGMTIGQYLDMAQARTDTGVNLVVDSRQRGGDFAVLNLRDLPLEAKTVNISLAIHEGRWVEFLVKPDTGPAHFESPAPTKSN